MPIWQKVLIAALVGGTGTFLVAFTPLYMATIGTSFDWRPRAVYVVVGWLLACFGAAALYYKDKDPRHIWTEAQREAYRAEQAAKV